MIRIIFILFICALPLLLFGQKEYTARHIDVLNGLPSNTIYDICLATDGSIIIGHEKGLSRYNGVSFSQYDCDKDQALGSIVELEPGKYLCRSFNDDCYITEGNDLIRQDDLSVKDYFFSSYHKLYDNSVVKVQSNRIDKIWNGNKLINENIWKCPNDSGRINLFAFKKDELVMHTGSKIIWVDIQNTKEEKAFNINSGPKTVVHCFNEEFFVLGTVLGKSWRIDEQLKIHEQELEGFVPSSKFASICTIQDTILAIGTFDGLYLYDRNYKLISKTFEGKLITCLTEDSEGNIWVGTQLDGILVIPSLHIHTLLAKTLNQLNFSISNSVVIGDSIIVAGSYDGRLLFSSVEGELLHQMDLGRKSEVQSIYVDELSGKLYVDCLNLFEIDLKSYQILSSIQSRSVKDMIIVDDEYFLATSVGFHVSNKKQKILNDNNWFKRIVAWDDSFLLEAMDGLYLYKNEKIEPLFENFIGGNSEKKLVVNGLNNSSGRITFAVNSKVFELINGKTQLIFELADVKIKQTLASETCLWVTDGSTVFEYSTNQLSKIDRTKGLLVNDVKKLLLLNNKLLVSGSKSFQIFDKKLPKNNILPHLTFLIGTGTYNKDGEYFISNYNDNFIEINFESLPNISSQGKNRIEYRIKGVVSEWTEIANSKLILERLPYGNYVLEVKASNEDGVNSNKLFISLLINPPFYDTWWFRTLVILFLALLVYVLIRWRINIEERKNAIKLQTIKLESQAMNSELKALRSQMNPHFIFNSLSSIQSNILTGDTKVAYDHLSTFSSLLRQSLKFTSKEFITLEEELSFLKNYITLEQSRTNGGFEFEIVVSSEIDKAAVMFPSLLSQPFAENAIRHGLMHSTKHKILKISIEGSSTSFKFIIEDNGIGRKAAHQLNLNRDSSHQSYAMGAIDERIEMINKEKAMKVSLKIEDLAQGTKVILTFKSDKYE